MKVLSKLAFPHTYDVDPKVQDIDDGIESDALELKGQDGLALYVFPGNWVQIQKEPTDVSACSLYDEEGVRVGILERDAESAEAVLLFQTRNVWSTFFQDWEFESSSRVLADLFSDRDLQVADMWLRNYGEGSVETLLMANGPYHFVTADSIGKLSDSTEVSEASLTELYERKRFVFLDEGLGITMYKQSFSIGFLDLPLEVQRWVTTALPPLALGASGEHSSPAPTPITAIQS